MIAMPHLTVNQARFLVDQETETLVDGETTTSPRTMAAKATSTISLKQDDDCEHKAIDDSNRTLMTEVGSDLSLFGHDSSSTNLDFSEQDLQNQGIESESQSADDANLESPSRAQHKLTMNTMRRNETMEDNNDCRLPAHATVYRPRKSKIRFSDTVQAREILPLDQFTPEERAASFYVEEEFQAIRREAHDCVLKSSSPDKSTIEDQTYSLRGLESFTESGAEEVALHIILGYDSVLDTQEQQDEAGIFDEKEIAKQYRKVSLRCRYPARQRALQDRDDALQSP